MLHPHPAMKARRESAAPRWPAWRFAIALGVLALFVTMELLLMRALNLTPSAVLERLLPAAQ